MMNVQWIREQFAEEDAQYEELCPNGIKIKENDIIQATEKIGKNKAPSYDGMADIIFQKKYYNRISIRGYKPGNEDLKET